MNELSDSTKRKLTIKIFSYSDVTINDLINSEYSDDVDCWKSLSRNPSTTLEIVHRNISQPWCWYTLSANSNLTQDFVNLFLTKPWDFDTLLVRGFLSFQFCLSNRLLLEKNSDITSIYMYTPPHRDKFANMFLYSKCLFVTSEYIDFHSNKFWDFQALSKNPRLSLEFIKRNIYRKWDMFYLSAHHSVTGDFVLQTFYILTWDLRGLCCNPNATLELVLIFLCDSRYSSTDIDWYHLSSNPNITMSTIQDNLSLPWNPDGLSRNPNVTLEFILSTPELSWKPELISSSTNISILDLCTYMNNNCIWHLESVLNRSDMTSKLLNKILKLLT